MTSIDSADLLEAEYGDGIRHLALEHKTGYLLSNALSRRQTPLEVSRKVCTTWLAKHKPSGEFTYVKTSGHLELWYGDRIRSMEPEPASGDELAAKLFNDLKASAPVRICEKYLCTTWSSAGPIMTPEALDADGLAAWLLRELAASAPARVRQKFLTSTWSSSGRILTPHALEEASGERLRLDEYSERFSTDELAGDLAVVLAEQQPPLQVSPLILRQWYTKYHPDSGSLAYATAEELEEALGDFMRSA